MRQIGLGWVGVVSLMLIAGVFAEAPGELNRRIATLVDQLGTADFARREAAEQALIEIGEPARTALESAKSSDDPEIAERADRALGWLGTWRSTPSLAGQVAWGAELRETITGEIAAHEGSVYVVSERGEVVALDQSNGKVRWRQRIDAEHFARRDIAVAGQTLVTTHGYHKAVALNAADGSVRWQLPGHYGWNSPVASGETIYLGGLGMPGEPTGPDNAAYANSLLAIDAATGEIRWEQKFANGVGVPVIDGGDLFTVCSTGRDTVELHCLDKSTGQPRWKVEVPHFPYNTIAVDDRAVYHRCLPHGLRVHDRRDGRVLQTISLPPEEAARAVARPDGAGCFYVGDRVDGSLELIDGAVMLATSGSVAAFELSGGRLAFHRPLRIGDAETDAMQRFISRDMGLSDSRMMRAQFAPPLLFSPVAHGRRLYVGSTNGLIVLSALTGEPTAKLETLHPVVARPVRVGNALLLATADLNGGGGSVIALDLSAAP